ncbi:MAG: inositol monophosphatase family protein, partial [Saccharopolyspora rectivirgula]
MNAKLRDVAVQVAVEAADLARTVRDESVTEGSVGTKSTETDVVTAGDRAVERLVRERLAELRPGDAVLGEEEGGDADLAGLRWVVDPIDGTVNYLYGYPWYAVSLAAQVDGVSVAGAVVEPVSGRVWSAARGA